MAVTGGIIPDGFALIIFVATLLAFIAYRTKQPTIMAYLLTGILLGPMLFDVVGQTAMIELMSELGLTFLLFLIGLEIRFEEVKDLLRPVLAVSLPQMLLIAVLGAGTALLLGFGQVPAVIIGIAVMYSSTAVVVKLLTDKREHATVPGKIDIGVLLVQDVAVVVIMVLLAAEVASVQQFAVTVMEILLVVGFVAGLAVLSSRYILPPLFASLTRDLHIFFIHGIAWAFLFIWIAESIGLSMEVGAFLAGLGLAQLPYSSELQERVRPLTDFFMALFFVNFGLGLSVGVLQTYWVEALIMAGVLMAGKFLVIFWLADWQRFTPETSFKAAVNMAQTSEFALILGVVALNHGYITEHVLGFLSIVTITTMAFSTYLINFNEQLHQWVRPVLDRFESPTKSDVDTRVLMDHAVIVGYNDLAQDIAPVLEEYFDDIVVIDRKPEHTAALQASDYRYIYGDFRHSDIRHSARIVDAGFIISFIPDHELNLRILDDKQDDAIAFIRSDHPGRAAELYDVGADYVVNKKILAASKLTTYIQDYLDDKQLFDEEAGQDQEMIWWRNHYD